MAHSCVVNVQLSFENNSTMVVKTTEPIEKGQGIFVSIANNCTAHLLKIKFYFYSDVKVSYIDPLQTTLQRRKVLAKRFSPKIIAGSIAMKDPNLYLYFLNIILANILFVVAAVATTQLNATPFQGLTYFYVV